MSVADAKGWFLAVEARLQKANAEEMVAASERQVGLARDRLRVGRGDEYDVALARANLATFRDSVQSLELAYRQALRALEALAGRYPAAALGVPAQLAALPGPVPVGMPASSCTAPRLSRVGTCQSGGSSYMRLSSSFTASSSAAIACL